MPKVYIEIPDSFKVQDFLNAYFAANKSQMFLIDPDGFVILEKQLNIPAIGISLHDRSKDKPLGYQTGDKHVVKDTGHKFTADAVVELEMDPGDLPEDIQGESWALQVREAKNIPLFQPIAIALAEKFNVNIFVTPSEKRDDDPAHLEEEPANSSFPEIMKMCPIIIRKVTEVK
ncbi:MAG: hypothetical protein UW41_C0012G0015 [Candidatus Collierbacteria bacterium GW2011_GWC2_44_18]|uniref:Uncharacterized protein n=1 Tax=Candidatus Collierbacteria bacterium GW2011_GWC2_44_18 TaxID=1618392 RepID=A0A0G1JYU7_9BACT|nr:MAG: hypothetical protein UW16_C0031G0023 [Microgenomates group bacterium GW2011_GWC1_44_10]KKT49077.1 MAG: hypothetical protein UW41_C0012G0015 [Candidatus Collierbacteria bacterium GW2011_GWC2_44_18]